MQGEYRGDFTRDSFNLEKRFSRVLMQQGRPLLDADWNEQTSILLHYLRTLTRDLIGDHGGRGDAFQISDKMSNTNRQLKLGPGNYYVDGILCENAGALDNGRPGPSEVTLLPDEVKLLDTSPLLVYLDVWERHLTHIEGDAESEPGIREVALGGPDTCSRAQVVWQIRVTAKGPTVQAPAIPTGMKREDALKIWRDWIHLLHPPSRGLLRAKAAEPEADDPSKPCILAPKSRYRGAENQLYRVEIHTEGTAGKATFKWSRENGSVIFPIKKGYSGGAVIPLAHLGRDARFGLKVGDWVEVVDDDYTLEHRVEPLLKVEKVDLDAFEITLNAAPQGNTGRREHPLLRRWDHAEKNLTGGTSTVQEKNANADDHWIELEAGVKIQFQPGGYYRSGDYWLIPARVATGDVEWPGSPGNPKALPPHGVEHHYAPLAIVPAQGPVIDLRNTFIDLVTAPQGGKP
ncbi:MAG: DUF6519 domain-containing protein [Blastocatellia bacterium]|nr:DUF6519 domain-containing protein [Blastocatellia bacterium]